MDRFDKPIYTPKGETNYHIKLDSPYNESVMISSDIIFLENFVNGQRDEGKWLDREIFIVEVRTKSIKRYEQLEDRHRHLK